LICGVAPWRSKFRLLGNKCTHIAIENASGKIGGFREVIGKEVNRIDPAAYSGSPSHGLTADGRGMRGVIILGIRGKEKPKQGKSPYGKPPKQPVAVGSSGKLFHQANGPCPIEMGEFSVGIGPEEIDLAGVATDLAFEGDGSAAKPRGNLKEKDLTIPPGGHGGMGVHPATDPGHEAASSKEEKIGIADPAGGLCQRKKLWRGGDRFGRKPWFPDPYVHMYPPWGRRIFKVRELSKGPRFPGGFACEGELGDNGGIRLA
jgi:hypothetical protein